MRILSFLVLATALAAPAHGFTAINGLAVALLPGGDRFEVLTRGGDGPREIWCAAGQFARATQGAANNDRLFIATGYGPSRTAPGQRSVVFTTRPDATLANGPRLGDGGSYAVSLRQPGFNLTIAHAEGFCADVFELL